MHMSRRRPGSRHHRALNWRRWAKARRACFDRDGHRCRCRCGCRRAGRLEAHHIVPLDVDPEQDPYAVSGLSTRCRRCHVNIHRRPESPASVAWKALVEELT